MFRTQFFAQMSDWEIDCQDKKNKFTLEYLQKLRIMLHYEKQGEGPKFLKIEETLSICNSFFFSHSMTCFR